MIAVVQRVSRAGVTVKATEYEANIPHGLMVLLCIEQQDSTDKAEWMAAKIANLRVFEDEQQRFNLSIRDTGGSILLVSQFTLAGDCSKGNRPSFMNAADPSDGKVHFDHVQTLLRNEHGIHVEWPFKRFTQVDLVNEGPATFILQR